jgi:outer membrane protein TolC
MRRALAWVVVGLAAVAQPALGAEPGETASAATGRDAPLPIHDGVIELSLRDAVDLAIQRNLAVDLVRYDPYVARARLGAAWGAYDPELFGEGGITDGEERNASALSTIGGIEAFDLSKQRVWNGQSGFRGQIPWLGGTYRAFYGNGETETNSRFNVLNPQYDATFQVTATVPLLRGLFWSQPWTQVRLARVGVRAADERFATDLMEIVKSTEDAYWALIAARDRTRVAEASLETAKALIEQTEAQYEVGVVSRVEVVQAEAGVADREFTLIAEQARERTAQDALIDTVLGPYLDADTELTVKTLDPPEEITVREVDERAALERAMARRPEIRLARSQVEQRLIEVKFTGNQRLPQLDIAGSYGESDLAGNTRQGIDPDLNAALENSPRRPGRNWEDAHDTFFTGAAPRSYSVRGILSIPLGNSAARHEHSRAKLELQRAETSLKRLEQSIVSEIRKAARDLKAALEGIEAAERGEAAAAEQLRAERVRLEHGESTPFDVLQREEDLVRAQAQKILAQQVYHNSVTALDRAQGTILERNEIVVEEAATLR